MIHFRDSKKIAANSPQSQGGKDVSDFFNENKNFEAKVSLGMTFFTLHNSESFLCSAPQ
jgi:hypothetical protein